LAPATFFRLRLFVKRRRGFRGAGVSPAAFPAFTPHKPAGETPAPQQQFDIWNSAHIMPQDFSERSHKYPE
jgi:hypothetical protein